jgi:hypothetical protein
MPRLINEKDAPDGWRFNSGYVYIGRPSKFGNPFIIGADGNREEVIEKYKLWFKMKLLDPDFSKEIESLKDKTLVCWCYPMPCHGDVICDHLHQTS